MDENHEISDESEEGNAENTESQFTFVKLLEQYPALLNKSQTPEMRKEKSKALKEIAARSQKRGVLVTETQITKKIFNMKSRLKAKTDLQRTGNKKIKLKNWEKLLLQLMNGNSNPSVNKLQGNYFNIPQN